MKKLLLLLLYLPIITLAQQTYVPNDCSAFEISIDSFSNITGCSGSSNGFVDVSTGVCTIWEWLDGCNNGDRYNMPEGSYTLFAMSCDLNCFDTLNITIHPYVCNTTALVEEHLINKQLLKVIDLSGRENKGVNKLLFYVYNDGTVEKRIIIK